MKFINITSNVKIVEHVYHANNHTCIDYAVLFTQNGDERFCGYVQSVPSKEEIDYTALFKAYEQNAEKPAWMRE